MRKAPCVILAAALTLLPTAPPARAADAPTSWQVHFRSTSYGLHTQDTAGGDEESHLLTYQTLSGGVQRLGADWLDLSGTWRYAGGDAPAAHLMPNEQRLYGALAEARVAPDLTVRAGRRFLQAGVASLFLDGASVDWRGGRTWQATAWGGGAAPQRLERMADFDQDAAAGAQIRWRTVPGWRIDLSGAYRERNGRVAARPVGAGLVSPGQGALRGAARAEYDLEREAWTRLQAQGQWRHGSGAELEFQYVDRTPQVDAASWFARFTDFERIRLARATARRRWPSGFGGEIEAWGSFVGDRSSTRLGLAALVPGGRIGYSVRTGDTGEENCWYGEWGTQVHPRVRVEGEASLLTWALVEDAPADQDRDVTTLAGRVRWDVGTGWQLRAEVQSLANTIYDQDVRFLVGLDVFGAAGSSRYGLGTGRSLP